MFVREDSKEILGEDVLAALVNDHDRQILAVTQDAPVEAMEISEATGIPRSTTYRRIRKLEERGLLRLGALRIRDGHQVERYRSTVSLAGLSIEDGTVRTRWRDIESDEECTEVSSPLPRDQDAPEAS